MNHSEQPQINEVTTDNWHFSALVKKYYFQRNLDVLQTMVLYYENVLAQTPATVILSAVRKVLQYASWFK